MIEIKMLQLLGVLLAVTSLGGLLNYKIFKKASQEIEKSYSLEMILSMFRLIFGLIIVIFFNVWTGPYMLLTAIGWLSTGIGVAGFLLPHQIMAVLPMMTKKSAILKGLMVICLALGLVLLYFGFYPVV